MENKKFFSFADGREVSDSLVNSWLSEIRSKIAYDGAKHWSASSGDVLVSAHVYETMIHITVSTKIGYCSVQFYNKSELLAWIPNFKRADLTVEKLGWKNEGKLFA